MEGYFLHICVEYTEHVVSTTCSFLIKKNNNGLETASSKSCPVIHICCRKIQSISSWESCLRLYVIRPNHVVLLSAAQHFAMSTSLGIEMLEASINLFPFLFFLFVISF